MSERAHSFMSIIMDARALRDDYQPEELYHRHNQINYITSALSPIKEHGVGDDILIVGPSGTGKTTIAKFALDELERKILALRRGYVNCLTESASNAVLSRLVRDLDLGVIAQDGTPRSRYLNRLRECSDPIVCIFDEVDMLADSSLLGSLYELPNVTLVCICIDDDEFLASVDDRIRRRLQTAATVSLDRYSTDQLTDIVWGRVEAGLKETAVTPAAVQYISDVAAGDARYAIALLRQAATRVDRQSTSSTEISRDVVQAVEDAARADIHDRYIGRLSTHKRALYEIILDAGTIAAGTLHDRYEDRVSSPRGRSMRRRYLTRLNEYGLIRKSGEGRGTKYSIS